MRRLILLLVIALTPLAVGDVALAQPAEVKTRKKTKKRKKKRKKKRRKPAKRPVAAEAPPKTPPAQEAPARSAGPTLQRSNRVEFDARLVRGEKASGAVYLFQRAPRRLPALVSLKRAYLDRIVRPVLRRDVDPEATPDK